MLGSRHHNSRNLVNLVSGEDYPSEEFSSSVHPDFTGSTSDAFEGHNPPDGNNNNNRVKEQTENSSFNLFSEVVRNEGSQSICERTDGRIYEWTYQWKETVTPTKVTQDPVTIEGQNNSAQRPTVEKPRMDFRDFQWGNQNDQDRQPFRKPQHQCSNDQNDPNVSQEYHDKSSLMCYTRRPAAGYSNSSSFGGGLPQQTNSPSPELTKGSSSSTVSGHGGGHSASAPKLSIVGHPYRRGRFVDSRGSKGDDDAKSEVFQGSSFCSRWSDAEGHSNGTKIGPSTGTKIGPSTGTKIGPSTGTKIGPSTGTKIGPSTGTKIRPSTGTKIGPSVSPNRPPRKCDDGKKKTNRITADRKKMMVQYYCRNKHKDPRSEYFKIGLWRFMSSQDPEVTREDAKRWHENYYMKLIQFPSIYTSPCRPQGGRKPSGSFPVKSEGRKERKTVDSKVSDIKIKTRSVFVVPKPSPKSLPEIESLEGQLIAHMTTYGQVKMHQYLSESRRFLITFFERFSATKARFSRPKSQEVGQYVIEISYAPPPSLFYAFRERYFDPTYGTSEIPRRELKLDLKLLEKECDVGKRD